MTDPVLTAEAMRAADERAIQEYGIPSFTLMESAGRGAARFAAERYGPAPSLSVLVWVGKGNNGGDGLVLARKLYSLGARVRVLTLTGAEEMSEDPARNMRLLQRLAERQDGRRLRIERFDPNRHLDALEESSEHRPEGPTEGPVPRADLHVDALLGTGLTSALRSPVREIVEALNQAPDPVLALDVPTGLDGDRGAVLGAAVQAEATVTMAAPKAGLILGAGPRHAGTVEVAEIGIPRFILEEAADAFECPRTVDDETVRSWLPGRTHEAHKYAVGMVLAVAGSPGLTGAPVMASTAAARIGAGAVVCASPDSVQEVLAQKMTEVMTLGLPSSRHGGLAEHAFEEEAFRDRLEKADTLLLGCGLGRESGTQAAVRGLLTETDRPAVIDADGLNALTGHTDLLAEHAHGQFVLTPHPGEFRRLVPGEYEGSDRVEAAREYAERWNCVLLLKGMPAVVGTPEGEVYVNRTGNPSVASAGTGDVLAGWCAGLLAQGLSPTRAAVGALHIGGAVADSWVTDRDERSLLATDLIDHAPTVLKRRFAASSR